MVISNVNELSDLPAMLEGGFITKRKHPTAALFIYNYTAKAQYERVWNQATLTCRGLITDENGAIISRPFAKFFNLEQVDQLPDEPFEVYEKLDGSLGITYWLDGKPYIATRGSFDSEQSKEANKMLATCGILKHLLPDCTYLFEVIYPENRIVVDYGNRRELVLLATIETATGNEARFDNVTRIVAKSSGFSVAQAYSEVTDLNSLKQLVLPNSEGFVIRFLSGFRVKVKLAEYVRLHKLLTGITEKTILEDYLMPGLDLTDLLERVPDEFNAWVRATVEDFQRQYALIESESMALLKSTQAISRKDYALAFLGNPYSAVLFKMLDGKDYSQLIWKLLKPKRFDAFKRDEL